MGCEIAVEHANVAAVDSICELSPATATRDVSVFSNGVWDQGLVLAELQSSCDTGKQRTSQNVEELILSKYKIFCSVVYVDVSKRFVINVCSN